MEHHQGSVLLTCFTYVVFMGPLFGEKRAPCLLAPPRKILFLNISNKSIIFKNQDTRLGAIGPPSKDLKWALAILYSFTLMKAK